MLQLFGRPTLTSSAGERVDLSPSSWRLLAAIAAAPDNGIARADLARLVVPTGKLGTLRKLIWNTRQVLDAAKMNLIEGEGDVLRLSSGAVCDILDLRLSKPGRPFFEIYRGHFFDTSVIFDFEPWKLWLKEKRSFFHHQYITQASVSVNSVDIDRCTRKDEARHLIRHAPDNAVATQILMLEGVRAADVGEVRRCYGEFRASLDARGQCADQRTTGLFHRLVGMSQRRLETVSDPGTMSLPIIYVPPPSATGRSRGTLITRSLLVDITIGLCRASLFRVTATAPQRSADPGQETKQVSPSPRSYMVSTSIIDHVLGQQIVFTLVSLPEQEVLWTERIEAGVDFSVSAYNLLTAGVLQSLVQRIQNLEVEAFRLEIDPGAYGLFLAGSSTLRSLNLIALRKGRHHLRRALAHSIDFAPTASALARNYAQEWLIAGRGERSLLEKARGLSLHAITSDPYEARGFSSLGWCDLYEKRYDEALENYDRAECLNRNYADLILEHANCLMHCGRPDQALQKIEYAMLLNPNGGDLYRWSKASTCFFLSRYDDVIHIIDEIEDREPVMRLLAATHALLGNKEDARRCRMKALAAYPSMTIAGWTNTMAMRDPSHVQHYVEGLSLTGFE